MAKQRNTKLTQEEFINIAKQIHGDEYDYTETKYSSFKNKIKILCRKHGEFIQLAGNHIHRKSKCPKCALKKRGALKTKRVVTKKLNGLIQPECYKIIPLSFGKSCIVDNEDFDRLKDICWSFSLGYAHNIKIGMMSRFIMNCPDNMFIDHINHNKLDNRKQNLRICSISENNRNIRKKKNKSSIYKGVHYCKRIGKWIAKIQFNKKNIHIGIYTKEKDAALEYDKKAKELFKEFAFVNFKN